MVSTLVAGPYGFKPVRHLTGGVIRANEYGIPTGYAANIFTGDLVATTTGVLLAQKNIILATTSTFVRGVFAGCKYIDSAGNVRFEKTWASGTALMSGTAATAYVYDDPNLVFKCQLLGTMLVGSFSAFVPFQGQSGGSLLTGISGETANITGHTGTANKNVALFILGLTQVPGNDVGGVSELEVLIAQHEFSAGIIQATGT
jgi:hypothetical protein